MPNTREKLIEILRGAINTHTEKKEQWILGGKVGEEPRLFGSFADHLIANGVTIQRWIPVTERLPEYRQIVAVRVHFPFDENARTDVTQYNPNYNPHFWERVTHWCELPEPPKGE